jgi:hypothetical protein
MSVTHAERQLPHTRDPLAAALLPVLMHRLNNATQVLQALNAMLATDERQRVLETRCSDLASAGDAIDEVGWLLAVLASACGADLLLARRERDGLAGVLTAVRDALRRERRELARGPLALPALAPDAAQGWRVPWAIGTWIYSSAMTLPEGSALDWHVSRHDDGTEVCCRVAVHTPHAALEQRVREHLPAASFRRTRDEHALLLPCGLLSWEGDAS